MSETTKLDLLSYVKGLFEKAVGILEPGKLDDFSVISGSILIIVGLEKLVKAVLHANCPLMILLQNPSFDDLKANRDGADFANHSTISFEEALKRVIKLHPSLEKHRKDASQIIKYRNDLVHNFGYLNIGRLEINIQLSVISFAEDLCQQGLHRSPEDVLGEDLWSRLKKNRDAYEISETLKLQDRISHLQRQYSQGQNLKCANIDLESHWCEATFPCPICNQNSTVYFDVEWDADIFDHREQVMYAFPIPTPEALSCQCGFRLSEAYEVSLVLGEDKDRLCEIIANTL
jgi:hypothetical protein